VNRRELLTGLASLPIFSLALCAQQPDRIYRLGVLIPGGGRQSLPVIAMFNELHQQGFIEGKNLDVVSSGFDLTGEQIVEQIPATVQASPDVLIIGGEHGVRAAQQATQSIPIIAMSEDLLTEGLVDSLARPGRNTTGLSILSPDLDGKRQDLLIELAPSAHHIAVLFDSNITSYSHRQKLENAARQRGKRLSLFGAARADDIVPAIDAAKSAGVEAINFLATPLFSNNSGSVYDRVSMARLPAIYQWPEMAEGGALASYGPRFIELFRQRARIAAKVLRGVKPVDIPVEQPTRFELVINLKSAKVIGHEIPASVVLRADKVIE
jgi:putative ABC transport system substrate-binding protein